MPNHPLCGLNRHRSRLGQLAFPIVMVLVCPPAVSRAQDDTEMNSEAEFKSSLCWGLRSGLHGGKERERAVAALLDFKSTKEARLRDELSALRRAISNNTLEPSAFDAAFMDTRRIAISFSVLDGRGRESIGFLSQELDTLSHLPGDLLLLAPQVKDALEVQLSRLLAVNSGELEEKLEREKSERTRALKVYAESTCDEILRAEGISDGEGPTDETSSDFSDTKTFSGPTSNGNRIDRCLHFGQQCDEPAASAWCRTAGYKRATVWKWDYIGANERALVQGSGAFCEGTGCGGFTSITCTKE